MPVHEARDLILAAVVGPGDHTVEERFVPVSHDSLVDFDAAGEPLGDLGDRDGWVQRGLVDVEHVDSEEAPY
jgi:hypothetical protein